jgi:signal transduction histidine kinase
MALPLRRSVAALLSMASRAIERRFLSPAAAYKLAILELSAELTTTSDPKEVAAVVEGTVLRWLDCERAELRVADVESDATPLSSRRALGSDVRVPACFRGQRVGWLVVHPKQHASGLTTDDYDLLRTIANQAALALAHAKGYANLEERRQQQAVAWQIERVALVETVAAEIAHEIRYPINFFRSVFRRDKHNPKLDEEEIDIGCEEVERLERLVSGLRRLAASRIERRSVAVGDLAARVEALLRDVLGSRVLAIDVAADAALRCDPHQATQLLVNLVANAIEATAASGRIGVEWATMPGGGELVVWDDGPGFQGEASRLFAPWFTTKPRGTGLGLAITQRIVRAHGWKIDAQRARGRTRFIVSVPTSDVVVSEIPLPDDGAEEPRRRAADDQNENSDRR